MTASIVELEQSVKSWLAWYRFRQAVHWGERGLTLGLMVALGFIVVARFKAVYSLEQLIQIASLASWIGFGWGVFVALVWPYSRMTAARFFDLQFDLGERTSTALELAQKRIEAPDWLAEQQLADAVESARAVNPRAGLPIRFSRLEVLSLCAAAGLVAASLLLPNKQFAILTQQQTLNSAVAKEVQELEAIRRNVADDKKLTDDQKELLTQPLNAAIQQLQAGNLTQQQAVSILSQAETQLQQLADQNALQQGQALQSAGEGLAQNQSTQALGESLQNNDLGGAADVLGNIDPLQMTAAEQQQLASSLEQAAQSLQNTNPQLAEQLQSAADALRNGDAQAAQSALDAASQTLSQAASQTAQAQAASAAAGQVGSGRQTVAQAGSGQQAGQGQSGQGQQGQGQGQSGQGQGQGQQGQSGQGQGASGAGAGSSSSNTTGPEAPNTTGDGSAGPNDGGTTTYEPIYSPYRLGGSGGTEVQLPGSGDPGSEVVGEGPSRPPTDGAAQVPYNQVFNQYNAAAQHAIDSGQAPVKLKPVIRDYFSSLEP